MLLYNLQTEVSKARHGARNAGGHRVLPDVSLLSTSVPLTMGPDAAVAAITRHVPPLDICTAAHHSKYTHTTVHYSV